MTIGRPRDGQCCIDVNCWTPRISTARGANTIIDRPTPASDRVGGSVSYQYSSGAGTFAKNTFSVTLSYDYTRTRSDTASKSESLQITHQETYPIPPNNAWEFKLILRYDQIDTAFTTQATRWYKEPLLGTTVDTTKSPGTTLYRRVEEVKGVLQGSFRYDTASTFVTTPL